MNTIEEERAFGASRAERDFWAALGVTGAGDAAAGSPLPAGRPEEDEVRGFFLP